MKCKQCDNEISEQSAIPLCEDCIADGVLEMEREAIKDLIVQHQKHLRKHKLVDIGTAFVTLGAVIMSAKTAAALVQSGRYGAVIVQFSLVGFLLYNQYRLFATTKHLEENGMELVALGIQQFSYKRKSIIQSIIDGEIECDWSEWYDK